MSLSIPPLAFIGGGNMASAIISGLCRQQNPPDITVCDPVEAIQARHAAEGLRTASDSSGCVGAEVVILAVKPQIAEAVITAARAHIADDALVISIMAGITLGNLAGWLPSRRLVRSMPNTPMAIGQGMIGICAGPGVGEPELAIAEAIFSTAGTVLRVDSEERIDAVTAVSGSGPAFLFRFAEAQLAAAQHLGFSHDEAVTLVGQTLRGSIAYLHSQAGFPAADLRQQVTSPGGTTAAGLSQMDGLDELLRRVYTAAYERSLELASGA